MSAPQSPDEATDLLGALRASLEAAGQRSAPRQLDLDGGEHPVTRPRHRRSAHELTLERLEKLADHPQASYSERTAITTVCGFLGALLDGRAAERSDHDLMF